MAVIPFEHDTLKFSLYAINILLQSINELPVASDTEVAELVEAQLAESVLEETKKGVLAKGWDINTDEDWRFAPGARVNSLVWTSGLPRVRTLYSSCPTHFAPVRETRGLAELVRVEAFD